MEPVRQPHYRIAYSALPSKIFGARAPSMLLATYPDGFVTATTTQIQITATDETRIECNALPIRTTTGPFLCKARRNHGPRMDTDQTRMGTQQMLSHPC